MNHPLLEDRWSVEDEPEHGEVRLAYIHSLDRARSAIETIARLVGNSAGEPDGSGAAPLDSYAVTCLMGGVESLCEHMQEITEEMLHGARQIREWKAVRPTEVSQ